MTSTVPASMGGPLSEAEQLRAENAKLLRKLELANKHRQHSIESRHKLESKLIGWREAAEKAAAERDAATARVGVLEEQLATARELARDWQRQIGVEKDRADDDRLTEVERAEGLQRAAQLKRHARQLHEALGPDLDGGGSDAETQQGHATAPDTAMDEFEAADEAFRRWE